MKDYLYIEFYYNYKNDKRLLKGANLYNSNELIKSFTMDEIRYIRSEMKSLDIKMKSNRGFNYVDDKYFVNHIIRRLTPKKKQYYINKKMIGLVVGASLISLLAGNKIINHNSTSLNNPVVEAASIEETSHDSITEKQEDNIIPISTITDAIEKAKEEPIEENSTTEEIDSSFINYEEQLQDNGFDDIFEFTYEDRSSNENVDIVNNNYYDYINTYSTRYGLSPSLMFAIICQENPTNQKNYSMIAGHGVPQIEGIFNNYEISAFNFESNQNESSGPIDVLKCVDDQDYSIKTACMIMNYQYNYIHEKYGYKLSKQEELGAAVWSYNKGITIIDEALSNTNTYNEFKDYVYINSIGGDNEYIEHVFSYIPDQEIVTMKTRDGMLNSVMIDNSTIENTKKPTTL